MFGKFEGRGFAGLSVWVSVAHLWVDCQFPAWREVRCGGLWLGEGGQRGFDGLSENGDL
jgi:hypothetical protein